MQGGKHPPFVRIEKGIIEGRALEDISPSSFLAYTLIRNKSNGKNEDDLSLTYKEVERFMSTRTYSKAIKELNRVGLIDIVRSKTFQKCNIYALSDRWRLYGTSLFRGCQ